MNENNCQKFSEVIYNIIQDVYKTATVIKT